MPLVNMERGRELKAVFMGTTNVGKTTLFKRLTIDQFEPEPPSTTGCDYHSISLTGPNGHVYSIHLWDTAGQERYRSITAPYFRNTDFLLLVVDLTSVDTFKEGSDYYEKTMNDIGGDHTLIVLGNKIDLVEAEQDKREISYNDLDEYANTHKGHYLEVSALSGHGIDDLKRLIVDIAAQKEIKLAESTILDINDNGQSDNCNC